MPDLADLIRSVIRGGDELVGGREKQDIVRMDLNQLHEAHMLAAERERVRHALSILDNSGAVEMKVGSYHVVEGERFRPSVPAAIIEAVRAVLDAKSQDIDAQLKGFGVEA